MSRQELSWQEQVLAQLQAGAISLETAEQLLLKGPNAAPAPVPPSQPIAATDIAIIGMACRFPDAEDWRSLWENLKRGVDSVADVPAGRWPGSEEWYHPDPTHPNTAYLRSGGFLAKVDTFDAPFFKISPVEAELMDPQQRIFLEEAYHAIEDAGLAPEQLKGQRCGVFVGAADGGYGQILAEAERLKGRYVITGLDSSILAARIAYFLDLQGPAVALNTACSTSLLAIHEACESIRTGEIDLALAGGISLYLTPLLHIQTSQFQMLSPAGRCMTFDAGASGFVPGEGCGVVLLKKAPQAIADGDPIHALIKGSGINQDGSTNGITAPSMRSQYRLEKAIYEKYGINPATIGYVEAHGTGTALGDPIEVTALTEAFTEFTSQKQFCAIGSIKTNIGHTLMAAGVAGVIKAVLCLQHGEFVPSLHFDQPNPHIDFAKTPFYVNTQHQPWPVPTSHPRRAATSSFGMSGTNAHLVLESAPRPEGAGPVRPSTEERSAQLLTLSAKSAETLAAYAKRYHAFLATHPNVDLGDLCYTSHVGRSHFPHRLSVVANSVATLQQQLATYSEQQTAVGVSQGEALARPNQNKVAVLFTGQGAQYVQMGRTLYASSPTFRAALERCDAFLRKHWGESLLRLLYPDQAPGQLAAPKPNRQQPRQGELAKIDDTTYTQPALFALEYALALLWQSWGVQPALLIGHSVGELVAACVAGVFSLEDALKLVAARGQLMGALPQDGAMVALTASEARVQAALTPHQHAVSIAAVNGPESVVISGLHTPVLQIAEQLAAKGVKTLWLNVSHAFHSPLMEPMLAEFRRVAASITYHPPQLPLVSNVTGNLAGDEIMTPDYWVRHVRHAVRFADGVATLQAEGVTCFLEIGPKPTLLGMAQTILDADASHRSQSIQNRKPPIVNPLLLPSLRSGKNDWQQMLESLGALYGRGVAIDWQRFDQDYARRKVALPTYPFQPQRYWVEPAASKPMVTAALSPLLQLVAEGKVAQLHDQLLATGKLTADVQAALPAVLELLITQHQQQQTTAGTTVSHAPREAARAGDESPTKQWLYDVQWQPAPLAQTATELPATGSWLIFADERGIGVALAKQIEEQGGHALLVWPGAQFEATATGWRINPLSPVALQQVLQESVPAGHALHGVIHLWSLNANEEEALNSEKGAALMALRLEKAQVLGCGSALALVQALAERKQTPRLWLVTQGAVAAQGTTPCISQAPLWGLGGTVAQEYPELHCVRLDLDHATAPINAGRLLQELLTPDKAERVAYRNGIRYAAQLAHFGAQETSPTQPKTDIAVQANGAYLITGGTGGLGLQVARWLFDAGARHLVLTSRRGITSTDAQEALRQMEAAGGQIHVLQGDIAKAEDVTRILQTIEHDLPPLRGIIHAAGVVEHGSLREQQWDSFQRVMAPKVQGSWHLHTQTQSLPLDFMVYFSSAAALLDTGGVGSYAAANAFLDALAHYRHALGLPALSVNWGPWAEVGMAAAAFRREEAATGAEQGSGLGLIEPAEGLQQLAALLKQDVVQVGVLPINWARYRYLLADATNGYFFARFLQAEQTQGPRLQETLAAAPLNERFDLVVAYVRKEVAQVLGFANPTTLAITAGLTDSGIDSLMAVELRNRLQMGLGCTLPTSLVFDYPSVEALATYLTQGILAPLMVDEDDLTPEAALAEDALAHVHAGSASGPNGNGKATNSLTEPLDDAHPDGAEELSAAEIVARLAAKLGMEIAHDG